MAVESPSDAPTFSNLNPDTSDADVLGGNSSRFIWGTNVSLVDSMNAMKDFLFNFQRKYRLIQDGQLEEGASLPAEDPAMAKEYVDMMKAMLEMGVTPLNLDARNLKAYPPTRKLWHQLQAFPSEIIPLMDVAVKDAMIELAEKRMAELRVQLSQAQRGPQRGHDSSSLPPMLSSDAPTPGAPSPAAAALDIPDLVREVDQKTYRVRPFGLDQSVNLRDLNPGDMDKLVSVKGLVIRATPIIPDMKDGKIAQRAIHYQLLTRCSLLQMFYLQSHREGRHRPWQDHRAYSMPSSSLRVIQFHADCSQSFGLCG